MKKLCPVLLVILLLTLCACAKEPAQEPSVQNALAQANTVEEPVPEEVKTETPPQELPEEPAPPAVPTPELLQKRLEHASLCTCLMEQGARWHLMQVGALEETEEDAPFLSAIAAMEEELTARPEDFGTVAEDTLWLLDSAPEGGFVLEFIQAGPEENTVSCRSLVFDGKSTHYQAEAELLESLYFSGCADTATEEEHQRILDMYDRLSGDDLLQRSWRVSMAHGGQLALTALSMDWAQVDVYYPAAQTSGKLVLNTGDIVTVQADDLLLECLRTMPDGSVVDADEVTLLRGFLAVSLQGDDVPRWDAPVPLRSEFSRFYNVKNAFLLLLRDLRADETLAAEFLARESWVLIWDAGFEYTLIAQGTEDALTVHLYPAGIDVDGYQTPSRKNLERLAREGENSDQVPEKVREQFILAVLRHLEYGRMMSGEFGEAVWAWREVDGDIQLKVDVMMENGTKILLTARFVTTASGNLSLSVSTDAYTVGDS